MKKIFTLSAVILFLSFTAKGTQHTIVNAGYTFSPSSLTINAGDTVIFDLGSIHDAMEVSEETWNANGNTPDGGFTVPFGGGTIVLEQLGIHYYVCEPHASLGMKGTIEVVSPTNIEPTTFAEATFHLYPNPASDFVTLSYTLSRQSMVNIKLVSITGAEIATLLNKRQSAGIKQITLSLDEKLVPGIYFLQLNTAEGTLIRKLVIE